MKKFVPRPYVIVAMAAALLMGASAGAFRLARLDELARQKDEALRQVNVDQERSLARLEALGKFNGE